MGNKQKICVTEVHQAHTAEAESWEKHFEAGGDSLTGFMYWLICSAAVADWFLIVLFTSTVLVMYDNSGAVDVLRIVISTILSQH